MQVLFLLYGARMDYNQRMKEIADKRRKLFCHLHDEKRLSFVQIARQFGISPQRARQIYEGKSNHL